MVFSLDGSYLSAARRRASVAALRDDPRTWDLVVVGAGITGSGIALDASLRGMSVLLVDAHDLAFGTSRWSSKLAHGGLRYLATGNIGIARRSARERGILMEQTAPHLVHPIEQIVPIMDRFSLGDRSLPRIGFLAGDAMRMLAGTSSRTLPRSRTIGRKRVRELFPAIATEGLRGGYLNYDGKVVDDARLVTAVARTAAGYGAEVLTYTRALRATGTEVVVRDELAPDSGEITVRARTVVNATGVWVGELQPDFLVRPSRGSHVIVRSEALGNPTGQLTVPIPGTISRFCFVIPEENGRCFIGLTDEENPGPIPDQLEAPPEDVDWILEHVNRGLARPLTRDDVIGTFSGLRPLLELADAAADTGKLGSSTTADLSRDHAIVTSDSGMVTVAGGKLTEYRFMAEETVDTVVQRLDPPIAAALDSCRTETTPLIGAPGAEGTRGILAKDLAGLPPSIIAHYGHEAPSVLRAAQCERPLEQVAPGIDVTRAELEFAVRCEGALNVSDLLDRRTRIGLVATDREAAEPVAREMLELVGA